ncbi:MAG: class I SAM-dependent DNA methyltransferase [Sphaerochaeta sp.]|jgi:ubiquinone/menaquinone biosynthesis C-methylase UbiE
MGIIKRIFNQVSKPEGLLGNMMVRGMNSGHARLSDWGLRHLPKDEPDEILEIGCGGGRNVGELLKKYPSSKVTAIDYSSVSVDKSTKYNKKAIASGRCVVKQGDVSALELPKEKYALATAFETIYFWPGLERCFAEVFRVLENDGVFLIVNESDGTDSASLKFEKIIDGMKCYTKEEIEAALRHVGFQEIVSYHHQSNPWIAVLAIKSEPKPNTMEKELIR